MSRPRSDLCGNDSGARSGFDDSEIRGIISRSLAAGSAIEDVVDRATDEDGEDGEEEQERNEEETNQDDDLLARLLARAERRVKEHS